MAKKTLRVALVMGGGVSLGSFNGGAVFEVVRLLHQFKNQDIYQDVKFDVFSGASAGGVTLSMLLRILANPEGRSLDGVLAELERWQELLWVEKADLSDLMPVAPNDKPAALFSRLAIEKVTGNQLFSLKGQKIAYDPANSLLGERVCLGIALMNYNGLRLEGNTNPALQDALNTTLFRDYRIFCLDFTGKLPPAEENWINYSLEDLQQDQSWLSMLSTAVAGSAFPAAFEPVVLTRYRAEYGERLWPSELNDHQQFNFTFGDGGAFNNEPLREAYRMISFLDGHVDGRSDNFDRILVFVDPYISKSPQQLSLSFQVSPDEGARIIGAGSRLAVAIQGQAAFKDVRNSTKIESRLAWRDELRDLLWDLIQQAGPETAAQMRERIVGHLKYVLDTKSEVSQGQYETNSELNRIWWEENRRHPDRHPPEINETAEAGRAFYYRLLSLLDQVAGLRGKQSVPIVAIGPTTFIEHGEEKPIKLAGDFMGNFGGFFDLELRRNDYAAGQAVASSVLSNVMMQADGQEVPLLKDAELFTGYHPKTDEELMAIAKQRQALNVTSIQQRIDQIIEIFVYGFSGMLRTLITFLVNRVTKTPLLNAVIPPMPKPKQYTARLQVIVLPNSEQDRYCLKGYGKDVAATPYKQAEQSGPHNGDVLLETLVHLDEHGRMSGKHIWPGGEDGAGAVVVCRKRLFGHVDTTIALKPVVNPQAAEGMALPLLVVKVQPGVAAQAEDTLEDVLRPHVDYLRGLVESDKDAKSYGRDE